MNQLPWHLFVLFPRKSVCQDATKIIEPKLDDTQCGFCRGRSTKEKISTLQKIFNNSWDNGKDHTRVLSISGKCMAGFFVKSFGGCYGSTVLTGASCWPSSNCIPARNIVSASEDHNCSALLLGSDNGVCYHHSVCIRALYTTALGPNPTCETISLGRNTFGQYL